jgi:hypothetical protein
MKNYLYDEIAKVAYDLHEKRGRVHGRDAQDWFEAEKIVLARYEKSTGKEKSKKSLQTTTKKGK